MCPTDTFSRSTPGHPYVAAIQKQADHAQGGGGGQCVNRYTIISELCVFVYKLINTLSVNTMRGE
jgi:hypothetical protein